MHTVLVTSAGTSSAVSIIRSIKNQQELTIKVVACDVDKMAAGLYLADEYFLSKPASDPEYLTHLIEKSKEMGVGFIFPTHSSEIGFLAIHQKDLNDYGIKCFFHPVETIELVDNKEMFVEYCSEVGLPIPKTYHLELPDDIVFPIIAKPMKGSSSRGVQLVRNRFELDKWQFDSSSYLIQEYVEGEEFTVDLLTDFDGKLIVISARRRIAVKSGQVVKSQIVNPSEFRPAIDQVLSKFKLRGVFNVQFMKNTSGLYLIEINPRFAAGGLMLTIAAGANIPLLMIKVMLGIHISEEELIVQEGLLMTRFWNEVIIRE